jgi:hypothetical protein
MLAGALLPEQGRHVSDPCDISAAEDVERAFALKNGVFAQEPPGDRPRIADGEDSEYVL